MEFIENSDANYTLRIEKIPALLQSIVRKYSVFSKLESLNLSWKIDRSAWKVGLFVGSDLINTCDIKHRDIGATQLMLLANLIAKMWKWEIKDIDINKFVCDSPQAAYYLLLAETSLNRNGNNYFAVVDTREIVEPPISFSFEFIERVPADLSFNNPGSPMIPQSGSVSDKNTSSESSFSGHKDKKRILDEFVQTGQHTSDLFKAIPYQTSASFSTPSSSKSSFHSNPFKLGYQDSYTEQQVQVSDSSMYMVIFNELRQKGKIDMTILSDTKSGPEHIPTFTVYATIHVKFNTGRVEDIVVSGSSLQRRNAIFEALSSFFNLNPIGIQLLKNPNMV